MVKAFAPRENGGCSWVLLSLVLVAGFPVAVRSQPTPAPSPTTKPARGFDVEPEPKPEPGAARNPEAAAAAAADEAPKLEVYRDTRAEKLLPNTFPALGKFDPRVVASVKAMAGGANADRPTIEEFVQHCMAELPSHNNIRALIDPENIPIPAGAENDPGRIKAIKEAAANAASNFAIKEATNNLVEMILI